MSQYASMLGRYAPDRTPPTEEGTVLSIRHRFTAPVARKAAEEKLRTVFRSLSPKAMVDRVILGHFKGAIHCGEAVFAISVTRAEVLDETGNEAWNGLAVLPEGEVTLNLLSVVPVPVTERELREAAALEF